MSTTIRSGSSAAVVHPDLAMLVSSWSVHGRELLASPVTPERYADEGSFTGMPLMYPWANRLSGHDYPLGEGRVELPHDGSALSDPNGAPIHGAHPELMAFDEVVVADDGSQVTGRLHWGRLGARLDLLPVDHVVEVEVTLFDDARLRVRTTLVARDEPLPVSFGWHPYLTLGPAPSSWVLHLPERTPVVLDDANLPTGATSPRRPAESIALAGRDLDGGFVALGPTSRFVLTDGTDSIEVDLVEGYDCAQLYAPDGAAFACIEPMTAPTDAMRRGGRPTDIAPGDRFRASFELALVTL